MVSINRFWDNIDAILVINLQERSDRWAKIFNTLELFGVGHKVIRIDAVHGKEINGHGLNPWFRKNTPKIVSTMKAGAAGCCLSHRKAIELASDKGFKSILVLEDDALFNDVFEELADSFLGDFVANRESFDMLYLGFSQKKCIYSVHCKTSQKNNEYEIWKIRGPLMTHAMVIQSNIFSSLLNGLPTEKNIWSWIAYWGSIDSWIQNYFGRQKEIRIFGVRPNLIIQNVDYSDICDRILSKEEVEGTHRSTNYISKTAEQFEKNKGRSCLLVAQQFFKRSGRLLRAYLFGFSKT